MKVSATIVYSVGVTIEVGDDSTDDQIHEQLMDSADDGLIDKPKAMIISCSLPQLVE